MSTEQKKQSVEEHMKLLERRANVVRSRLMRAVDALDVRRHQVTETVVDVKEAAPKIGLSAAFAVAAVAGAILGMRAFVRSRRDRLLTHRIKRVVGGFRVQPKPSLVSQIFEKAILTFVTMAATEVSRRTLKNLVDGRSPDGRLAVGQALEAHHQSMNG